MKKCNGSCQSNFKQCNGSCQCKVGWSPVNGVCEQTCPTSGQTRHTNGQCKCEMGGKDSYCGHIFKCAHTRCVAASKQELCERNGGTESSKLFSTDELKTRLYKINNVNGAHQTCGTGSRLATKDEAQQGYDKGFRACGFLLLADNKYVVPSDCGNFKTGINYGVGSGNQGVLCYIKAGTLKNKKCQCPNGWHLDRGVCLQDCGSKYTARHRDGSCKCATGNPIAKGDCDKHYQSTFFSICFIDFERLECEGVQLLPLSLVDVCVMIFVFHIEQLVKNFPAGYPIFAERRYSQETTWEPCQLSANQWATK